MFEVKGKALGFHCISPWKRLPLTNICSVSIKCPFAGLIETFSEANGAVAIDMKARDKVLHRNFAFGENHRQ